MQNDKKLSIFRFLEKLKAGLGAAGLAAVLLEASRLAVSLGFPMLERLGDLGIIAFALIAFFIVSLFADLSEKELERESDSDSKGQ